MAKNPEVDKWLAEYDNPMKETVASIREIVLNADPRMEECIKWQAPTFTYKGNMASFFPKAKKHASLMFHEGASIPGAHPLLEGEAKAGRSMKIVSVEEAMAKQSDIQSVVKAWCDLKDSQ